MNGQTVSCTSFNTDVLKSPEVFLQRCKNVTKRKTIPLRTKYEIIQRLKNGETKSTLLKEYNLPDSTFRRIAKMKDELEEYYLEKEHLENLSDRTKLSTRKGDPKLHACIEIWYLQNYYLGNVIPGKMLQEKAREFSFKLNGTNNFKASSGWLQGFKSRCGIKKQHCQNEKSPINNETALEFKNKFSEALKNDKHLVENIYSAEENILWWKTFSNKTEYEKNAPKVTLVIAANAAGTHKIPLMIIGRSKIPSSLSDNKNIPIEYKAQDSSWMDNNIFMEWLKTIFVPSVKKRQQEDGKHGSIVLLLDSAASRYVVNTNIILSRILVKIVLLPINLTSDVLPMNQGIIEKLKVIYRQNFRKEVNQKGFKDDTESVNEFLKTWNLRDSCHILKSAWESISSLSLTESWEAVCTEDMFLEKGKNPDCKPELLERISDNEDSYEVNNCLEGDSSDLEERDNECVESLEIIQSDNFVEQRFGDATPKEIQVSNEDVLVSMSKVCRWIQRQDAFKKDISYVNELYERIKENVK